MTAYRFKAPTHDGVSYRLTQAAIARVAGYPALNKVNSDTHFGELGAYAGTLDMSLYILLATAQGLVSGQAARIVATTNFGALGNPIGSLSVNDILSTGTGFSFGNYYAVSPADARHKGYGYFGVGVSLDDGMCVVPSEWYVKDGESVDQTTGRYPTTEATQAAEYSTVNNAASLILNTGNIYMSAGTVDGEYDLAAHDAGVQTSEFDIANARAGVILTGQDIVMTAGTVHGSAEGVDPASIVAAEFVVTGHDNYIGGAPGTYPTTERSKADQSALDVAEVTTAAGFILDTAVVLGVPGGYHVYVPAPAPAGRPANWMTGAVDQLLAAFGATARTTITYQRGNLTVAGISATVGAQSYEVFDGQVMIAYESRDYILKTADLVCQGVAIKPASGDRIIEEGGAVYEVAMPKPLNVYETKGPTGSALKIHTKGPF